MSMFPALLVVCAGTLDNVTLSSLDIAPCDHHMDAGAYSLLSEIAFHKNVSWNDELKARVIHAFITVSVCDPPQYKWQEATTHASRCMVIDIQECCCICSYLICPLLCHVGSAQAVEGHSEVRSSTRKPQAPVEGQGPWSSGAAG